MAPLDQFGLCVRIRSNPPLGNSEVDLATGNTQSRLALGQFVQLQRNGPAPHRHRP